MFPLPSSISISLKCKTMFVNFRAFPHSKIYKERLDYFLSWLCKSTQWAELSVLAWHSGAVLSAAWAVPSAHPCETKLSAWSCFEELRYKSWKASMPHTATIVLVITFHVWSTSVLIPASSNMCLHNTLRIFSWATHLFVDAPFNLIRSKVGSSHNSSFTWFAWFSKKWSSNSCKASPEPSAVLIITSIK